MPELNAVEDAAFLLNLYKAVLLSLKEKMLLTASQYKRCLDELEKEYIGKQKNKRRA